MAKKTIAELANKPRPSGIEVRQSWISTLRVYENNPKDHSKEQIARLARSIAEFGFVNPILVDAHDSVIAGHGRLAAARLAGLETVPTICLDHLSRAQVRAYRIADNRLAEFGSSWSVEKLQIEVAGILELDANFDLELSGFEIRELELSFDTADAASPDPDDEVPATAGPAVSKIGDVWRIGAHRLVCGDALEAVTYLALLGDERPVMVFSDPPYNVKMKGHATGNGKARHREFVQASGEMSDAEFQRFLLTFMLHCARFTRSGALHFLCMDWRHLKHLLLAGEAALDDLLNICVWAKTHAGMGSMYRSQHEFVAVFKKGKAKHINNIELGRHGRHRSNVWSYAGMNSFSAERDEALAMHPTVKPLALVRDAILDASNRSDIILDPFGGSGTTLIAAAKVGRTARLMELDPLYCDVIIARAKRSLGLDAVLASTGQSFETVAHLRQGGGDVD